MDEASAAKLRVALAEARHERISSIEEAALKIIKSQEAATLSALQECLPKPQELYAFADKIALEKLKEIDSVDEATELMVSLREAIIRWGLAIEKVFKTAVASAPGEHTCILKPPNKVPPAKS